MPILSIMSNQTNYKRIDNVNTVTSLKSSRFNFQTIAERASDFIVHHNERKSCMDDEEDMIPHN